MLNLLKNYRVLWVLIAVFTILAVTAVAVGFPRKDPCAERNRVGREIAAVPTPYSSGDAFGFAVMEQQKEELRQEYDKLHYACIRSLRK